MSKSLEQLQPTIIRTGRGLTINGTRITLYHLMAHLRAGRSPAEIREWLPLTEQQVVDAIGYIEAHYAEVEVEYEQVLKKAAENRRYWEERNRDRLEQVAKLPPKQEYAAAWTKLQTLKNGDMPSSTGCSC